MANRTIDPTTQTWPPGVGMIYLGMSPWQSMWKNRHQLMSRFSSRMPVLYVEPPIYLRWLIRKGIRTKGFWRAFTRATVRKQTSGPTIMHSSYRLPVSGSKRLKKITEKRWLRAIRRAAIEAGIERPILWISVPWLDFAIDELGDFLAIYHVVDEYAGYTIADERVRAMLQQREQKVLDAVDLVIVVSEELKTAKSSGRRSVHVVENAVDLGGYQSALRRGRLPPDLARIPRPRLGYSGFVGKRLNLELLDHLATARRDWSIVFVGKVDPKECEQELRQLRSRSNVYFLGERPVAEVADYVVGFDLGMLPYAINLETTHISPLKMYEYLGAGLPIVSTDIPATRRMSDHVSIALDTGEFIDACERALTADTQNARETRLAVAAKNTWDQRVEEIDALIRCHLTR